MLSPLPNVINTRNYVVRYSFTGIFKFATIPPLLDSFWPTMSQKQINNLVVWWQKNNFAPYVSKTKLLTSWNVSWGSRNLSSSAAWCWRESTASASWVWISLGTAYSCNYKERSPIPQLLGFEEILHVAGYSIKLLQMYRGEHTGGLHCDLNK